MADLPLRVARVYDDQRYDRIQQRVILTRRAEYWLGDNGPFHFEAEREKFTDFALEQHAAETRRSFERFTT